jgi:hypothetical protein
MFHPVPIPSYPHLQLQDLPSQTTPPEPPTISTLPFPSLAVCQGRVFLRINQYNSVILRPPLWEHQSH